jgi:hypothetical protein
MIGEPPAQVPGEKLSEEEEIIVFKHHQITPYSSYYSSCREKTAGRAKSLRFVTENNRSRDDINYKR